MSQKGTYKANRFLLVALLVELVFISFGYLCYQYGERWVSGLKFHDKTWFLLLLAGPVLAVIFYFISRWKNKASQRFAEQNLMQAIAQPVSKTKHAARYWLLRLSLFLLTFALVNPKIGSRLAEGQTEGIDIMFCLDVSNSMLAEDLNPNRLAKAKRMIEQVIESLHGDRIGLVVFAGEAFVQLPLTTDYSAARLFLSSISPDIVPTQGTAIGSAIDLAFQGFDMESTAGKAIVVITDGENHEDDAGFAAKYASDNGVRVFSIGMGTVAGAPLPTGRSQNFKKDNEGNIVVSKLNAGLIEEIADKGNGLAIFASNSQQATELLNEEIEGMAKGELETVVYQEYEDRFQWFLLPAILLILIDATINTRKSEWLRRFKLFGHE
ncbi:MAG: VWA domain-containing protein [Luteibaculum sp.]